MKAVQYHNFLQFDHISKHVCGNQEWIYRFASRWMLHIWPRLFEWYLLRNQRRLVVFCNIVQQVLESSHFFVTLIKKSEIIKKIHATPFQLLSHFHDERYPFLGQSPSLYSHDVLATIAAEIMPGSAPVLNPESLNRSGSAIDKLDHCLEFYFQRVVSNLHIVLLLPFYSLQGLILISSCYRPGLPYWCQIPEIWNFLSKALSKHTKQMWFSNNKIIFGSVWHFFERYLAPYFLFIR